jgi:predicted amidohydrolase
MSYPAFRVAAAHVAPVFLDVARTVDKACALIEEAARHGAQLVVFPEAYVPAFPVWGAVRAPIHNHEFFRALAADTMLVPGPELARVAATARACGVFVSLGFNEGTPASVGCIWNANVLIGDEGAVLNHHRKLVPTFFEKLVWANGDGAGLRVCETRLGRIGMLICGENTNPLARYTLMAQGEQVHISTYPPVWPTKDPKTGGNYDLAGAIRIRAGAHAFEAKAFNVVVSAFMDEATREAVADGDPEVARILESTPRGVTMVLDPAGEVVAGPVSDREELLYADIDLARCVEPKQYHDVVGSYNRFDIFKLTVNRAALRPITFEPPGEQPAEGAGGEPDRPDTPLPANG